MITGMLFALNVVHRQNNSIPLRKRRKLGTKGATMTNKPLVIFLLSLPSVCFPNNFETWNTVQVSKNLGSGLSVGASEESRIGVNQNENPKKFDEFHTTVFVDWRFCKYASIGVQDDFVLVRDNTDARYKRDNRPGVNLAFYENWRGVDLMSRLRFVMRDLENERPYFRYRSLSKVVFPEAVKICDVPIRPYFSYEWYFDEGSKDRKIPKGDKFSQFWTDAGVQCKISETINLGIFYRLVEMKSPIKHDWSPGHVFGVNASFHF